MKKNIFIFLFIFLFMIVGFLYWRSHLAPYLSFTIDEAAMSGNSQRNFFINFKTLKSLDCDNNLSLNSQISQVSNHIKVTINEIVRSEQPDTRIECWLRPLGSNNPIQLSIGDNYLDIEKKGIIDKYKVVVTTNQLIITKIKSRFSSSEIDKIDLTIPNILEAKCFYNLDWMHNPKDGHCERFFQDIASLGSGYLLAETGAIAESEYFTIQDTPEFSIKLSKILNTYDRKGFNIKVSTSNGLNIFCNYGNGCSLGSTLEKLVIPSQLTYVKIANRIDISKCKKDDMWCIMEVAFNTQDEKFCYTLRLENQPQCKMQVGIAMEQFQKRKDTGLCEKVGYINSKEGCIKNILNGPSK